MYCSRLFTVRATFRSVLFWVIFSLSPNPFFLFVHGFQVAARLQMQGCVGEEARHERDFLGTGNLTSCSRYIRYFINNFIKLYHLYTFLCLCNSLIETQVMSKGLQYLSLNSSITDQISRSVVSDSLRPHGSQHTRPPCPSPTPGVH